MERNAPILIVLTVVLGLGMLAAGRDPAPEPESKPDFSGNWELNIAKSKLGKMAAPSRMTLQANRKADNTLHAVQSSYDQAGGPNSVEGDWYMDGKERALGSDGKMTSMSKWDGNTLVSERRSKDGSYSETIRLTISKDGKTATEDINVKDPNGSDKRSLVWDRK